MEVQATYGKALILARTGEEAVAAQALQRAIDAGSQSTEVRHSDDWHLQQGRITDAMNLYKESIRLDPSFTPAYLDLAHVYSMLKDRDSALKCWTAS